MTKARFTWKREPDERGLARVCQGERGKILSCNGEEVARVRPKYQGYSRELIGYYWYGCGMNTSQSPKPTIEQAMADCIAYVRTHAGKE